MNLKGKRIFIVEDNLSNRAIMQLLLERNGAVVHFDRWGLETVKRLESFMPVDLILMDLMFPNNVTGFEVAEQIRHHEPYTEIPIVAVSAQEPALAIPQAKRQGFLGFLLKPIRPDAFLKHINDLLDGTAIWQVR